MNLVSNVAMKVMYYLFSLSFDDILHTCVYRYSKLNNIPDDQTQSVRTSLIQVRNLFSSGQTIEVTINLLVPNRANLTLERRCDAVSGVAELLYAKHSSSRGT